MLYGVPLILGIACKFDIQWGNWIQLVFFLLDLKWHPGIYQGTEYLSTFTQTHMISSTSSMELKGKGQTMGSLPGAKYYFGTTNIFD